MIQKISHVSYVGGRERECPRKQCGEQEKLQYKYKCAGWGPRSLVHSGESTSRLRFFVFGLLVNAVPVLGDTDVARLSDLRLGNKPNFDSNSPISLAKFSFAMRREVSSYCQLVWLVWLSSLKTSSEFESESRAPEYASGGGVVMMGCAKPIWLEVEANCASMSVTMSPTLT
jgi:hypothetical protein